MMMNKDGSGLVNHENDEDVLNEQMESLLETMKGDSKFHDKLMNDPEFAEKIRNDPKYEELFKADPELLEKIKRNPDLLERMDDD